MIAEGFWYGGILGACIVASSIAVMAVGFEHYFRRQLPALCFAYVPVVGVVGFGVFYGLQPCLKAFELAILLGALVTMWNGRTARTRRGAIKSKFAGNDGYLGSNRPDIVVFQSGRIQKETGLYGKHTV